MKKDYTKIILTIAIIALTTASSMAQFTLSGEFRTRAEANNGYKYIPTGDDVTQYYVSQRTRLNLNYKTDLYTAYLSLQDVRAWGSEDIYSAAGVWGDENGVDIYQAWVDLKLNENSTLKIGRQEFKYNDQRLLCARDWAQHGLTHDAVVFKTQKNGLRFDLGLSYNSTSDKTLGDVTEKNNYYFDDKNRYKTMNFIYLKKRFNDHLDISFTGIHTGYMESDTTNDMNHMLTYGFHANYKKNGFEFMGNAFHQTGKSQSGKDKNAYMLTADLGYKVKNTRFGIGADVISGHDASNTDEDYAATDHTFNLLYGARYKYYGNLNHFILMDKHTKNGGLIDIYPNIAHTFKKNILKAYFHIFSLQQEVYKSDNETTYDKSLGSELNMMYIRKINKEINVKAGLAYSMPSETLKLFKTGSTDTDTPFWGWVMITVKPTFFTTKK